jgi:putative transposase
MGWLRYRKSREIEGIPKIVTVSRDLDGWSVSIMTELQTERRIPVATAVGAGDRGVTNFLATAAGRLVAPLDAHKSALHRLGKYQRAVARRLEAAKVAAGIPKDKPFPKGFKFKPSNRLKKAQARVAKIHQKIARLRADFLHNLSTELADSHAVFCIEDLNVRGMSSSAAGTAEAPGKKVRQKAGLNRSILDQGWSMWAGMLEYKLLWRGGQVIKVPAAYTSQKCSVCGHIHPDNRNGDKFKCLDCGHVDHADINAAKNILAAGFAVLAGYATSCAGVEDSVLSDRPEKRLPTEGLRYAA